MTTTTAPSTATLNYDSTVSRTLVHRWSLSEVFLTGYAASDATHYACAAQLPLSHGYFRDYRTDHPQANRHDPLNILEACRQAVTLGAHLHQGLPAATTFMVSAWTLCLTHPAALAIARKPGELRADVAVTNRRERGGSVRQLAFAMGITLDGAPLGELTMDVNCTPTDQYHKLRRMQRGGAAPTAFTLPAEPVAVPVEPVRLGRRSPVNVVLDGAVIEEGVLTALLSPRSYANRSMYDHPYDHVPAMVLSEAARQSAQLLESHPSTGSATRLDRLVGRFQRFAELDAAIELTTTPTGPPGAYLFTARQRGMSVADIEVVLH